MNKERAALCLRGSYWLIGAGLATVSVSNELMQFVLERHSGRNSADKIGRLSDLLNTAVTRRAITTKDKRGFASARIGRSISKGDGEEDC